MKSYTELVNDCLKSVKEIFPWDLEERMQENPELIVLDIREPNEYQAMHIENSIHVPRGVLEGACEYHYDETVPELVRARDKEVVVICRSGHRSVLAARTMQLLGYNKICSMKTGLRGWNDYELPLVDSEGNTVDIDDADEFFTSKVRPDQRPPAE